MTRYDHVRCVTCGCPFFDKQGNDIHPPECSRYAYRPAAKIPEVKRVNTLSELVAEVGEASVLAMVAKATRNGDGLSAVESDGLA